MIFSRTHCIYMLGVISIIFWSCKRTESVNPMKQSTFLHVHPNEGNQIGHFIKEIPNVGFFVVSTEDTSYAGYGFQIVYVKHFDLEGKLTESKRLNIHNFIQGALISELPSGNLRIHGRLFGSRLWKFGFYEIDQTGNQIGGFRMLTESGFDESLVEENPNEWLHQDASSMVISLEGSYSKRTLRLFNSNDENWPGSGWPGCVLNASLFEDSIRPTYGAVYDFSEAENDGEDRIYKVIGDFILPPYSDQSNTAFGIYTVRQKRDDQLLWNKIRETRISDFKLFDHYAGEKTNQGLTQAWLKTENKVITVSGPHYKSGRKWSFPADRPRSLRSDLTLRVFGSETQQLLLEKQLRLTQPVTIESIHVGESGRMYLTGYIFNGSKNTQPIAVCLSKNGNMLWTQQLNNLQYGSYNSAFECSDGTVLLGGWTNSFGSNQYGADILVSKCNQENGKF